jgi:cation:H+ antiporter
MLVAVCIFLVGLGVLSWSADKLVFASSALARNIGISPMIIGLTIVSMGSSAPEIVVAATASLAGNTDTAVGNALGSNITNIALVLGLTALTKPLLVSSTTVRREMPILLLVSILAGYFVFDDMLDRVEGVLLIILFFVVLSGIAWISMRMEKNDPLKSEAAEEIPLNVTTKQAVFYLLVGLLLLPLSAHFMVESAVSIAHYLGLSELVIGLTIIAIGTSLPELAACTASVLKGEDDLALGNIIGSNIFNLLAVLAMPGLIAPGAIDPNAGGRDIFVMLGLTLLLLVFSFSLQGSRRINRWHGGIFIGCFMVYQYLVLAS